MNKTKNLVFALILTSAILLAAVNVSSVTAATTSSTYIYASIGGSISSNGNALTAGSSFTSNTNENANFTATPESGFKFLAWEYATAAGGCTVKTNPLSLNITASGAIQALFLPTTNTTAPSTQTGSANLVLMNSIGGETVPTAPGSYTNYTVNTVATLKANPGSGFKFLYWIVATSTANYYTTSTLDLNVTESVCAVQAMFIPTDSDVTLPGQVTPTPIPEFSSVATAAIAVALVAVALGTYTYSKKAKK